MVQFEEKDIGEKSNRVIIIVELQTRYLEQQIERKKSFKKDRKAARE